MEILYIMWLRQLKRYWRSKTRMLGIISQPLLFLIALGFGLGHIYQKAGSGDYIQFLAPGVIAMSILFTSMFAGIEVIWDRQFGFLKETLVAPVSRFKIMLGRTLGGATVSLIQGIIVSIICLIFGFKINNFLQLPIAFIFMLLIAIIFTALGTAIASKLEDMQTFPLVREFLIMPIFFLSGALFPLEGLPKVIEIIARIDPLSYGVDGLRGAMTGVYTLGLGIDLLVLVLLMIVVLALGSYLFSKIQL